MTNLFKKTKAVVQPF